ncbi:MAG: peroxidase, partial [Actinomycetota bacterium]
MLQEGIYHASGARPGNAFLILFLRVSPGQSVAQAGAAFARLWGMYQALKEGRILDLPGHPVPAGGLSVLVGYGVNVFDLAGARVSAPSALRRHGQFRSPLPTGGGPLLIGSGLRYGDDVRVNPATEEIVVQFIANTQLAVNRAVVETWKALHDLTDPETGIPPLLMTGFYQGFQRDDGRSWIDFHDGVSNLRSEERAGAISIKPSGAPEETWVEAGTYLAFVRLEVDLPRWRGLNRDQQELLVGRDKPSGCPIEATDQAGRPLPHRSCPVANTKRVSEPGNEAFREPPDVADPVVRISHV